MNALVLLLTHIMIGRVQRTSRRMTDTVWWRIPIYLIVIGSAVWVAVASAWLWTSEAHPGVVGLITFVRGGGPAWLLSVPIVAALTVLVGSLPAAGRYGLVAAFETATFALTLAGMATFQANGHAALNLAAVSSFLVAAPATLLALVAALADTPPIEAALAPFTFVYIGRVGLLRALAASARRLGWEVGEPRGFARALTVSGYYGSGRHVQAVCGWNWRGTSADCTYYYRVTLTSMSPLPAFRVAHAPVPRALAARVVSGKASGGLNPLRFYVIPRYGQQISEEWTERFKRQVADGGRYLRTGGQTVQLTPGGLIYGYVSRLRLATQSGNLEPLIEWLTGIARLLEEIAPTVEQVAPPATADYTPRLPYGQISSVDPTASTW